MRFLKGLFFGFVLALLGLVGYFWLNKTGLGLTFVKSQSTVQGLIHLEVSQDLTQVEGLQLVSEFIFPYDFITTPYPNWSLLALKDPRLHSALEREQMVFFDAVRACGYDLALRRDEFFLVRVKAGLGYDFLSEQEAAYPWEWWHTELYRALPEMQVLYFMLDDSLYLQKRFVNSQIDAFTWRCLIEYLEPKLYNKMITADVKEQAAHNVAQLIDAMRLP